MKGQRKGVRGMGRGGRAEQVSLVGTDGLFPRYQGKTCDGTSPSGRFSSIWVAPQKFQTFVPKEPIHEVLLWMEVFF